MCEIISMIKWTTLVPSKWVVSDFISCQSSQIVEIKQTIKASQLIYIVNVS